MSIAGLNTSKRTRLQWYINKKEDVFQSLRRRIRLVTVGIRNTGRSAPDITYLGRDTLAGTVQTRDGALGLVGVERLKKKKRGRQPESVETRDRLSHRDDLPPPTMDRTPFLL